MNERFRLISAVHLFLMKDNNVLLQRRFNTGYEDGKYSVVAGHLDGGETIKSAIIREAREEIGIDISSKDLEVVQVMHRLADDERIDFFLKSTTWNRQIVNNEPNKCDDLSWFDIHKLPNNLIPYVKTALDNYLKGVWFDSFGW